MKPRAHSFLRVVLPVVAGCFCAAPLALAEKSNSPGAAAITSKATAMPMKQVAPPPPVEIPSSVFVIPASTNRAMYKDPFFPRSSRPYNETTPVVTNKTNPPAPTLVLNGLSGTAEKPLAVINNVTFGVGDFGDVFLAPGKRLPVQCLEINLQTRTAVVQYSGQRKTLQLKGE